MPQTFWLQVYSARFASEEKAFSFAEYVYAPEPENAEDEWDEDPKCRLAEDIGVNFQPKFRETIFGDERFDYLATLLENPADAATAKTRADPTDNVLFLIFEVEDNWSIQPKNGQRVRFCGRFRGVFR